MPDGQDTTPVKLKDGTVLNLKGKNLTPQQVSDGVAKFRMLQAPKPAQQPSINQPQPPTSKGDFSVDPSKGQFLPKWNPPDAYGFTPAHVWDALKTGTGNIKTGLMGEGPKGEGGIVEVMADLDKYVPQWAEDQSKVVQESKNAFKSGQPLVGFNKALFAVIPFMSRWLNDKYNQASAGDIGGSSVELATTFAAAKLVDAVNEHGPRITENVKDMFPRERIIAASNDYLEGSKKLTQAQILQEVKNVKENYVGGRVRKIANADRHASAQLGSRGSFNVVDADNTLTRVVSSLNAQRDFTPMTNVLRKRIQGYGQAMSWEDVKDLSGFAEGLRKNASGKDSAILGSMQNLFRRGLEQRAEQLGLGDVYSEYVDVTKNLSEHEKGIIKDLNSSSTGLDFYNKLYKESNRPRVDDLFRILEEHGGLPRNYIGNLLEDTKPIYRLAKTSEGSSILGMKGGRITALMQHKLAAGGAFAATGVLSSVLNVPPSARWVLSLASAMEAGDLVNRYEAAARIRELGGPPDVGINVLKGQRRSSPPGATSGAGIPPTGGGGGALPGGGPSGGPPPGAAPSGGPTAFPHEEVVLEPALRKLLPKAQAPKEVMRQPMSTSRGTPTGETASLPPELKAELEKQAGRKLTDEEAVQLDRSNLERGMATASRGDSEAIRQAKQAELEKPDPERYKEKPPASEHGKFEHNTSFDKEVDEFRSLIGNARRTPAQQARLEELQKLAVEAGQVDSRMRRLLNVSLKPGYSEPPVTKVPEGEHGREASARSGMTRDTPEARKAKARERVAKAREEAGRTKQKASLEEQARALAGKITPSGLQSANIVDIEDAAKQLDSSGGKIYAYLQRLRRQQKWSDELYRGYLEDFILKQVDKLAQ